MPAGPTFGTVPAIRATLYGLTDRGRTRDHNEDTFLFADLDGPEPVRDSRLVERQVGDRGVLLLVADGMGGAAAGELASEMAATEIHRQVLAGWAATPLGTEESVATNLRRAVEAANAALFQHATTHADLRGMGTTATVAVIWRDRLYLAQIGDSRAYLYRDGHAHQLTRDQSLTQRLVEVGELTEEEAEASERRNIILQALGPDPKVKVDLSWQRLQRDDLLVLCSDGLTSVVRRDEMSQVIGQEHSVERIGQRLVELANQGGGPDNITVMLARFGGDGLPEIADAPAYREFPQAEDRPALLPTAAFPAAMPPVAAPSPAPGRTTPTALALSVIAVLMTIIGIAVLLSR